jgi:hypothetical protein
MFSLLDVCQSKTASDQSVMACGNEEQNNWQISNRDYLRIFWLSPILKYFLHFSCDQCIPSSPMFENLMYSSFD